MSNDPQTPERMPIVHPFGAIFDVRLFDHTAQSGRQIVFDITRDADDHPALQIVCLDHPRRRASRITIPASLVRELAMVAEAFAEHERDRAVNRPRRPKPNGLALRAKRTT